MTAASGQITDAPDSWVDFVHVGPGTLAGRYVRMFWQPVYISKELLAGTATTFHLLDEDFTLYRGEDGVAHLLEFRCAHRNTQLNTGWVEGNEIRCFYHGWKYDGSGQCIEQPGEPEPFCNRIKWIPSSCQTWRDGGAPAASPKVLTETPRSGGPIPLPGASPSTIGRTAALTFRTPPGGHARIKEKGGGANDRGRARKIAGP